MEIADPPFFDYEYEYCVEHWLNRPKNSSGKYDYENWKNKPDELIPRMAKEALADALKASHYHLSIPPPLLLERKKDIWIPRKMV